MTRDNKNIGKRNNTMTQKLINQISINEIERLWVKYGCYKAAEELSKMLDEWVSFSTLRYLSQKFGWARPVNPKSPIFEGVKRGTVPAAYYKHLIFPEEITKNESIK
jgi:hypothetical protein